MQKLRQFEQQKEVQNINHNLRSYQFLLLVTCFGFGIAIVRQLKLHVISSKIKVSCFL